MTLTAEEEEDEVWSAAMGEVVVVELLLLMKMFLLLVVVVMVEMWVEEEEEEEEGRRVTVDDMTGSAKEVGVSRASRMHTTSNDGQRHRRGVTTAMLTVVVLVRVRGERGGLAVILFV